MTPARLHCVGSFGAAFAKLLWPFVYNTLAILPAQSGPPPSTSPISSPSPTPYPSTTMVSKTSVQDRYVTMTVPGKLLVAPHWASARTQLLPGTWRPNVARSDPCHLGSRATTLITATPSHHWGIKFKIITKRSDAVRLVHAFTFHRLDYCNSLSYDTVLHCVVN